MADPTFDHAKAYAASDALRTTADLIQNRTATRDQLAQQALKNWTGPHADRFRGHLKSIEDDAAGVIKLLRTLADSIDTASTNAYKDGVGVPHHTGGNRPN
jgi:uncharacterized protein YukE